MKKINEQKMDQLLSQYIDGGLTKDELQKIEFLISKDISVQHRLRELKRLKELLVSKPKLTPDIGFWTSLQPPLKSRSRMSIGFCLLIPNLSR